MNKLFLNLKRNPCPLFSNVSCDPIIKLRHKVTNVFFSGVLKLEIPISLLLLSWGQKKGKIKIKRKKMRILPCFECIHTR